jgi:hypothetical protein
MSRARARKPAVEFAETWWCLTCADQEERSRGAIIAHLHERHGFPMEPIRGQRRMVLHLDYADRYVSNYEHTLTREGVRLLQSQAGPR